METLLLIVHLAVFAAVIFWMSKDLRKREVGARTRLFWLLLVLALAVLFFIFGTILGLALYYYRFFVYEREKQN
ncbi:hypothetical protein [Methanonatronarchaeum sp. AMET6-2]|uniref:hypothetical protein n=1 Tax=Methanonatronarchaeum sp. AMET6-2 TaxID=2933293 RepID=UPI001FF4D423|nr:hypothetical protein [Methanonatronarchaeum sp. AMET6-2]UOY10243.1 hypothetical protein MU439_00995 [Methanonatronarchaeum sp. AMET6-2]